MRISRLSGENEEETLNIQKRRVVFLDRDGTLNEEVNYLYKLEDLRILPGVPEALAELKRAGYLLALITNQAGIGRGYYSPSDCERLNNYFRAELDRNEAGFDAVYYSPHHPKAGIGEYRRDCACRKPKTGLFQQAVRDLSEGLWPRERLFQSRLRFPADGSLSFGEFLEKFNISDKPPLDVGHSFMIGDKLIDTEAGRRFGLRPILVGTGYGPEERQKAGPGQFEYYATDMEDAAQWILRH